MVKLCGRTPEPRGFFGCRLPLGHAGPHDLGVEGKRRRPRPQWQEDGFDSALAAAVAYAGQVDTSGAVEEEGTGDIEALLQQQFPDLGSQVIVEPVSGNKDQTRIKPAISVAAGKQPDPLALLKIQNSHDGDKQLII